MPSGYQTQTGGFVPVASGVCSGATWERILVVSTSPVFDLIQWYQNGGWHDPNIQAYLKSHVLTGVAVPLTLFALVFLFFILFLIWRLVKCACFSTARVRTNPLAEITAPWLKAQQALVVVFMMAAIALCVVGMIKLPTEPLSNLDDRARVTTNYAYQVLDQADEALGSIRSLNSSLDGVQRILDTDIDAPTILAQIQEVQPFVEGMPEPAPLRTSLLSLHTEVHDTLDPAVKQLQKLLATSVDSLEPSVQKAAKLPALLQEVQDALDNFNYRLTMLPRDYAASSSTTGMAVALLRAAQDAMQLNAWSFKVQDILPALDVLDASREQELLPGIINGCQTLSEVHSTVVDSLAVLLPGLQQVQQLNPETLLPVIPQLIQKLEHINESVVILDGGIANSVHLLHLAQSNLQNLYPYEADSPQTKGIASLPSWISQLQALQDQVTDVRVVEALQGEAFTPSQQVNDLPPTSDVKQSMRAVAAAFMDFQDTLDVLTEMLLNHMDNDTPETYDQLLAAVDEATQPTATLVDLMSAADNSGVESFLSTVLELNDSLAGLHDRMTEGQQLLAGIAEQVAAAPADIQAGLEMLDTMSEVFKQLPSPVSQVFDAPRQLLDDTVGKATESLKDVRKQIAETLDDTSNKVQKARDQDLPDIERSINTALDTANRYWGYAYKGFMSGYGAIILLLLLLSVFSLVKCPAGLITSAGLLLLWLSLWLVCSIAGMALLVVLQDMCAFAERLIVSQALTSQQDGSAGVMLAQYYLFHQGGTNIQDVLRVANVVDINQAVSRMTAAQSSLLSNLQEQVQLTPEFNTILMDITNWVETVQKQANDLVALVEFEPVSELYKSIKSCFCCDLGAQILVIWICVTCSGMLAWLAVVMARFVIQRLDVLPRDNCMGCQCYWAGDYQAPSREVKRRFWGSWGGAASSTGGSSGLGSFGGASSLVAADTKALGLPGSSSGGTSSSTSSSGLRVSGAGDSHRHTSAWWKLVHPHAWHTLSKSQGLREENVQEFTTIVSTPVHPEALSPDGLPAVIAPSVVQMTGIPHVSSGILPIYVEAGHHVLDDDAPSAPPALSLHGTPSDLHSTVSSSEPADTSIAGAFSVTTDWQPAGSGDMDASCHKPTGDMDASCHKPTGDMDASCHKPTCEDEAAPAAVEVAASVDDVVGQEQGFKHEMVAPCPAEDGPTAPTLEVAPFVGPVPYAGLEMEDGDVVGPAACAGLKTQDVGIAQPAAGPVAAVQSVQAVDLQPFDETVEKAQESAQEQTQPAGEQ